MVPRRLCAFCAVWLLVELGRGGIPWTPAFLLALSGLWLLKAWAGPRFWRERPASTVFLGALAAYLSTFRWHGGDDITNSLLPLALLRHGTLALDPVISPFLVGKTNDFTFVFGARHLSFHPIAGGILAAPFYILPVLTGTVFREAFLHNLSKVSAACITAASAAAFHQAVSRRSSGEWALALSAVYALGSFAFSVSSQALWQHGPAQLGAALGLWGLCGAGLGWDALAGFGFGLAVAARTDSAVFAAAAGAFVLLHRREKLAGFSAGAAVPAAFLAFYWLHYTGRLAPPESHFQAGLMTRFQPSAFLALAVSPTRGLLFFCPAAVFGAWAGGRRLSDPLCAWMLAACFGTWVLFSHYNAWVGGMTYGPRYFAVTAMVLLFLCSGAEADIRSGPRLSAAWPAAAAASILIHALGGYMTWPGSFGVSYAKEQVWDFTLHPVLNILRADGPLGGLPAPVRAAALLAVLVVWGRLTKAFSLREKV